MWKIKRPEADVPEQEQQVKPEKAEAADPVEELHPRKSEREENLLKIRESHQD